MNIRREIKARWKPRKSSSHKGDYGRLFILAGSEGLTGAAYLASVAAVRAGAGLVTLGVPQKIYPILARRSVEVMVRPFQATSAGSFAYAPLKKILTFSQNQDVLALGPGLSQEPQTQKLVCALIKKTKIPLILDADALNALAAHPKVLKKLSGRAILTPHPGEFKRMFRVSLSSQVDDRRVKAQSMAKKYGVVVVLKGHQTVVANPSGKVYLNQTGNPGMATGGTGDVLTGIIAALVGQKFSLWEAARFGVYLHGLAGDLALKKVGEVSLSAGDLLTYLPQAIKQARGR